MKDRAKIVRIDKKDAVVCFSDTKYANILWEFGSVEWVGRNYDIDGSPMQYQVVNYNGIKQQELIEKINKFNSGDKQLLKVYG